MNVSQMGIGKIDQLHKKSKEVRDKILDRRLQYLDETKSSDALENALPFLRMQQFGLRGQNQWVVGGTNAIKTLVLLKLMKNMQGEKKRNFQRKLEAINKAELSNAQEKQKLDKLMELMTERYIQSDNLKNEKTQSEIEKTKQDIELGKGKYAHEERIQNIKNIGTGIGSSKKEEKHQERMQHDRDKENKRGMVDIVKAYKRNMKPEVYSKALSDAHAGILNHEDIIEEPKTTGRKIFESLPFTRKTQNFKYEPKSKKKIPFKLNEATGELTPLE
jgi:hypothetical protein